MCRCAKLCLALTSLYRLFCVGLLIYYRRRKTDLIAKLNKKERTKILHTQLMTFFRERIRDGRLPAGTRLPADGELAAKYQISRDTVRQALALLVNEGLIERVQGRGTFVSHPASNGSPVTQLERKQIGLVLNRTPTTN